MLRNVTLEEISDGKLYRSNDTVKADCQDCKGCSECCRGMDDTVVLDPLDVHRISVHLQKKPEELLASCFELGFVDGILLPHMSMKGDDESCVFLNSEGRCSIHSCRPGYCRMFPLGRYFKDETFYYILQIHECPLKGRTKIKIKKWLDTPDLKEYEEFVLSWHSFLRDIHILLSESENETLFDQMNRYIVGRFYVQPYDPGQNFYEQFKERLKEGRGLLE
ncbi:MAG: YkgJ family cysteine cluster protein [Blautia sp.]|nr:YkgJ family cysteine cluster protein [Blautia sp.]